jgi:serine/threonine protein kinase
MAYIGGTQEFKPNTEELLEHQFNWLRSWQAKAVVTVENFVRQPGICYYSMEYLPGKTLRQVMNEGPVPINHLLSTARALHQLSQETNFRFHGDIKPDNIIIAKTGAVLIDPGYFGPLNDEEITMPGCAITTPAYYPLLEPDDLLAFGLLVWEAVLKEQPLKERGFSQNCDLSLIGPKLLEWVHREETIGNYFLSSILNLGQASETFSKLEPDVQTLLLNGLRLKRMPNGMLERHCEFKCFSAFTRALMVLQPGSLEHREKHTQDHSSP